MSLTSFADCETLFESASVGAFVALIEVFYILCITFKFCSGYRYLTLRKMSCKYL